MATQALLDMSGNGEASEAGAAWPDVGGVIQTPMLPAKPTSRYYRYRPLRGPAETSGVIGRRDLPFPDTQRNRTPSVLNLAFNPRFSSLFISNDDLRDGTGTPGTFGSLAHNG